MRKICASELNRLVTIEKPVNSDNGSGGVSVAWLKVAEAWAKMRPARGSESMRWGQLTASTAEIITIRYIKGIREDFRIKFEGRIFNIRDIADIEELHIYLELACEEGVA